MAVENRLIMHELLKCWCITFWLNISYEFILLLSCTTIIFSDNAIKVSKCDGLVWFGTYIFVDMKEIGRPCTCTVSSFFVGDLLVTTLRATAALCSTRVIVNYTIIFNCNDIQSTTFSVIENDIVVVKAENTLTDTTGSFHQCVGLTKNGNCFWNMYTKTNNDVVFSVVQIFVHTMFW